ncbi:MAG TPA: V-type ATP synthase subunit F [Gemmatimonadales bacterium]|nr:V-type ATP synthase subunit F [Gemmatimonadales bacterium]
MGGALGVRVLARPEIAAGFALAGLRPVEAVTDADASERLDELLAAPDIGVVLMEERLYDGLAEDVRRRLGRRALPMVVPFPEPAWVERPPGAEAYIVELLRQVIGYRVRLK